jgi:hypothetical protein
MPSLQPDIIIPFPAIIGVDPKLLDAHLPNHIIQLVPAIHLGPHRPNSGPPIVVAKQLRTGISSNRLSLAEEHIRSNTTTWCEGAGTEAELGEFEISGKIPPPGRTSPPWLSLSPGHYWRWTHWSPIDGQE